MMATLARLPVCIGAGPASAFFMLMVLRLLWRFVAAGMYKCDQTFAVSVAKIACIGIVGSKTFVGFNTGLPQYFLTLNTNYDGMPSIILSGSSAKIIVYNLVAGCTWF